MRRGTGVVLLLLALGMLAIGLWRPASPQPEGADAAVAVPKPDRIVLRSDPSPASGAKPVDQAAEVAAVDTAEPAAPPQPRVPLSPAEEGLFAWADATAMSVIRCRLDQFPEGFELEKDDVVSGDILTRMVTPNEVGKPNSTVHLGDHGYVESRSGAYVGTIGECTITVQDEPIQLNISPEQLASLAEQINEEKAVVLDDVDDTMHPIQVALDAPDLSPEARAWLVAKLATIEAEALDVQATPRTGAALEDALQKSNALLVPAEE